MERKLCAEFFLPFDLPSAFRRLGRSWKYDERGFFYTTFRRGVATLGFVKLLYLKESLLSYPEGIFVSACLSPNLDELVKEILAWRREIDRLDPFAIASRVMRRFASARHAVRLSVSPREAMYRLSLVNLDEK